MENYCKYNLEELENLLSQLQNEQFAQPLNTLFGASIGQHIRHILEFYLCLLNGLDSGIVSYDKRERDIKMETDANYGLQVIKKIGDRLEGSMDVDLMLDGDFSPVEDKSLRIQSSCYRELAYCLEHSIHHQALIKVGLVELGLIHLISDNFGVAPATIRHRSTQVQLTNRA